MFRCTWCFIFQTSIFHCICIFSNEYNVLFYHAFLWLFPTIFSCWSFTGVWMTSKLFRSWRLLSILADHNSIVICMVLILSLISTPQSLFPEPLWTVPRAPTAIVITVTFMIQIFFSSLARSIYLFLFSFSFIFPLRSSWIWWQIRFSFLFN